MVCGESSENSASGGLKICRCRHESKSRISAPKSESRLRNVESDGMAASFNRADRGVAAAGPGGDRASYIILAALSCRRRNNLALLAPCAWPAENQRSYGAVKAVAASRHRQPHLERKMCLKNGEARIGRASLLQAMIWRNLGERVKSVLIKVARNITLIKLKSARQCRVARAWRSCMKAS